MAPVLTVAPDGPLVAIDLLRQHLRIDADEDDLLLAQYEAAAVSFLDGWSGVLGRAILPQTWVEEFDTWGCYRLAMPDVQSVVVTYRDAAGAFVPGGMITTGNDGAAAIVEVSGPATTRVRVAYVCGMPEAQVARARQVAMLLIGNWYRNRESVVIGTITAELPHAARSLIASLQWRRV